MGTKRWKYLLCLFLVLVLMTAAASSAGAASPSPCSEADPDCSSVPDHAGQSISGAPASYGQGFGWGNDAGWEDVCARIASATAHANGNPELPPMCR